MTISILYDVEGAKQATGIAVVIDIYRAATTAAYALAQGASYVIPVLEKEHAFTIKKKQPQVLLMGEEQGIPIEGFDFGNSPAQILRHPIQGKVIVQRTTQGTKGLLHVEHAQEIIFGSFPTLTAIKTYIHKKKPETVSIVAMDGPDTEDDLFAQTLADHLLDKPMVPEEVRQRVFQHPRSARFFDPAILGFREEDAHLALDIDRFDFFCLLEQHKTGPARLVRKKP